MFKVWFKCARFCSKCSCVGGERSRLSERLRGNAQRLYLKWSLTARPIAKFNVLVCSYFVLIIPDDVLVRVVRADVINKLFKFKYSLIIVFLARCAFVPISCFTCQLVRSPMDIVLRWVVGFYQADQSLGSPYHVLLFATQKRIECLVVLFCIMLFIGVGNVLVALMYVLGQLLEMFISRRGFLSESLLQLFARRRLFIS